MYDREQIRERLEKEGFAIESYSECSIVELERLRQKVEELQRRNDCQARTIVQLTTAHCEGDDDDRAQAGLFRECIMKLSNHEVRMLWHYLHSCALNHPIDRSCSNMIEEEANAGNTLALEACAARRKVCNYQRPDMRDW